MSSLKLKRVSGYACVLLGLIGLAAHLVSSASSISNFPFPISWSESGRIFNAYQVYAPLIDGKNLSWPWLDPGRAILDGLVFLLPYRQVWLFRLWVVLLSFISTGLAAYLIVMKARRYGSSRGQVFQEFHIALLVLWGLLFIFQGPIYTHLLIGILPILWFFDSEKPFAMLLLVSLCSAWEGLCRVNWFLMPAALATTLYLFLMPMRGKHLFRYLLPTFLWFTAGGVTSFSVYGLFIKLAGYPMVFLNPKMDYGFFRFKLWPNSGFNLGLIPGILLAGFPVGILILYILWKQYTLIPWKRFAMIGAFLGLFFAGSTLVSLRAGGGFDLHNYDTFLTLLFLCGIFLILGAFAAENHFGKKFSLNSPNPLLILMIIPVFFAFSQFKIREPFQKADIRQAQDQINLVIKEMGHRGGPILFIDHRQLLVFHLVSIGEIVIPYEKVELMEMAMANRKDYFVNFWGEIQNKKYSLIVSEVLVDVYQGQNDPFGYENNVWFERVTYPILQNYYPVYHNKVFGVAIYAPK